MQWGYCLSDFVAKNDSETRLPGGGIELKLKTFGEDLGCSTTNEEHICTGSVSELNTADVKVIKEKDGKYKLEGEGVLVFYKILKKKGKFYKYFDIYSM